MYDEQLSAHQFSKRSQSIQADEEERLDAEMQMSAISTSPKHSRVFSAKSKSRATIVSLPSKTKFGDTHTSLLSPNVGTNEMAVQTDRNSDFENKKHVKVIGADGEDIGTHLMADPDAYKEDWANSNVFKRAMKAEAIKRGLRVDSDFECADDEDRVEMTATHCESKIIDNPEKINKSDDDDNDSVHLGNAQDIDDIQGNNIGFMK